MSFILSYSLLLLALYTWNSPLPAPALEPWTFFIISRAGRIFFPSGGGGMKARLDGSLNSRSSCERCFSRGVTAWRCVAEPVVVVLDDMLVVR